MKYEQQKTVREFYDEFSKKVNDTVKSLEMVNLEANTETFDELNLRLTSAGRELWGLLIFCEHGLYFYVHPWESPMATMFRQAVHGKEPIEQLLAIHLLDSLKFSLPKHRWYEIVFSSATDKLQMEFKGRNGRNYVALLTSQNRASKVLDKINSLLSL
jgi:hypothetical protein